MMWYTKQKDMKLLSNQGCSPALLLSKWHAYPIESKKENGQWGKFRTLSTNKFANYFDEIGSLYEDKTWQRQYQSWYEEYTELCTSQKAVNITASTQWKLAIGWGTQPALERGINLHPIMGHPQIPAEQIKGLLHAIAERNWLERWEAKLDTSTASWFDHLDKSLDDLDQIIAVFGSLSVLKHSDKGSESLIVRHVLPSLFALIKKFYEAKQKIFSDAERKIIDKLKRIQKAIPRQGAVLFFDAVPTPTMQKLIVPEVFTNHDSNYYKNQGQNPPTQANAKVNPLVFPVVDAEIEFNFWFAPVGDQPRWDEHQKCISKLLDQAFLEYGFGAKTAAGFGYFKTKAQKHRDKAQYEKLQPVYICPKVTPISHQDQQIPVDGSDEASKYIEHKIQAVDRINDKNHQLITALWKVFPVSLGELVRLYGNHKRPKKKMLARIILGYYVEPDKNESEADQSSQSATSKDEPITFEAQQVDIPQPTGNVRTIQLRLISPLIVGDAYGKTGARWLRAPSVRGALAFWTRALAGDTSHWQRSEQLWGSTDVGQRITMIGAADLNWHKDIIIPLFPEKTVRKEKNGRVWYEDRSAMTCVRSPNEALISLQFRLPYGYDDLQFLQWVFWLWLNLGAVGRRSNRGYGSLQWIPCNNEPNALMSGSNLPNKNCFVNRDEIVSHLKKGLKTILNSNVLARRRADFPQLITLDQVFVGEEIEGSWLIENKKQGSLQHKIHGIGRANNAAEEELGKAMGGRLPSPMRIRLFQLNKGNYVPVMTWFPFNTTNISTHPNNKTRQFLDGLGFNKSLACNVF